MKYRFKRFSFPSLVMGTVFGCFLIYLLQDAASSNSLPNRFEYTLGDKEIDDGDEKPVPFIENESLQEKPAGYDNQTLKDTGKKQRILCWILTSPANYKTRAKTVKETWGKRCDVLLFMSSAEDPSLPAINLPNVKEGHDELWGKTKEAFLYSWRHYRDQVDWFYKADDDTYTIVENLRYFLSGFNTSEPLWFGYKFKVIVKGGYFSGGAGYVLSKEATRRFVEQGYNDSNICRQETEGAEDAEMGSCMQKLNVSAMDTRDSKGQGRFFPFDPPSHLRPGRYDKNYWYWTNMYYPIKQSDTFELGCCSDSAISFHYVKEEDMYLYDYLIYKLRPFGERVDDRPATPEPPPDRALTATPWVEPTEATTISTTSSTSSSTLAASPLSESTTSVVPDLTNSSTNPSNVSAVR